MGESKCDKCGENYDFRENEVSFTGMCKRHGIEDQLRRALVSLMKAEKAIRSELEKVGDGEKVDSLEVWKAMANTMNVSRWYLPSAMKAIELPFKNDDRVLVKGEIANELNRPGSDLEERVALIDELDEGQFRSPEYIPADIDSYGIVSLYAEEGGGHTKNGEAFDSLSFWDFILDIKEVL